jgi:hypothetical protein
MPPRIRFEFGNDEIKGIEFNQLTDFLNKAEFPLKKVEDDETISSISKKLKVSTEIIESLIEFLLFIFDRSDTIDDLIKFFSRIEDTSVKNKYLDLISSLTYLQPYFDKKRLDVYKIRANTSFQDVTYACDLRARFKEDYNYNEISIENYEPEILDVVPLITIQFTIGDSEGDRNIWFQADEQDLDKIISSLLAAQKELKKLSAFQK